MIFDTAGVQVFLPGITDADTLDLAEKLCGTFPGREHGAEHVGRHPVMAASMTRELPDRFALIIRGNLRPVIARMPMAWRDPAYVWARWHNRAVASIRAAAWPVPQPQAPLPPMPSFPPVADRAPVLVPAPAEDEDDAEPYPWSGGAR